jgi:hypothetical protein
LPATELSAALHEDLTRLAREKLTVERNKVLLENKRLVTKIRNVDRYNDLWFYGAMGILSIVGLSVLKIIHDVATLAKAGHRGTSMLSRDPVAIPASFTTSIPTFRTLVENNELSLNKPMILCFENGLPRRGSFLDIYSSAVAGESGSGKTGTCLFLIGSGLLCEPQIRFYEIDPHFPHPKSLGKKTEPLWKADLMKFAHMKDDMLTLLKEVEQILDNRLKQHDTDTTPIVLVIDELAFLSKTSIGKAIAHMMERISTEGRGCQVYMLAASQTWLTARTGKSSVVRDTLTSAYVHRIKPKQANLLLQDREEADKVKKFIKQEGDVLFCPVGDESVIGRMPLTTEGDMKRVAERMQTYDIRPSFNAMSLVEQEQPDVPPLVETSQPAILEPEFLVKLLHERCETRPDGISKNAWQRETANQCNIGFQTLKNVMLGHDKLTAENARKLYYSLHPSTTG